MNKETFIHPSAEISPMAEIGGGTKIWHNVQVREHAVIGHECVIGKDVYIDTGVKIGNGVKIQNGISIYKGTLIEDLVILGPNCVFTNDPYPRAFPAGWEPVPTILKKGCSVGANATIVCGVTIAEYTLIGAGAVVTRNTLPFSMMAGNPARLRAFVCVCGRELRVADNKDLHVGFECDRCGRSVSLIFDIRSPLPAPPGGKHVDAPQTDSE